MHRVSDILICSILLFPLFFSLYYIHISSFLCICMYTHVYRSITYSGCCSIMKEVFLEYFMAMMSTLKTQCDLLLLDNLYRSHASGLITSRQYCFWGLVYGLCGMHLRKGNELLSILNCFINCSLVCNSLS